MKKLMDVLLLMSLIIFSSAYANASRHHIGSNGDVDFYLLTDTVSVSGNSVSAAILRDWQNGRQEYTTRVAFSPWGSNNLYYRFVNEFNGQWLPVRSNHWSGNAVAWLKANGY